MKFIGPTKLHRKSGGVAHLASGAGFAPAAISGVISGALEKLVALGALTAHSEPTAGPPSTLWSAIDEDEHEENGQSISEDEEPAENE
jgi:hypothetical protein